MSKDTQLVSPLIQGDDEHQQDSQPSETSYVLDSDEGQKVKQGILQTSGTCRLVIRTFEFLLLVTNWFILMVASSDFWGEFEYLTIWGMTMTLISVVLSLFQSKDKKTEPYYLESETGVKSQYKFFSLWKWNIFMFELAISLEIVIAPYFWAFLWSAWDNSKTKEIETINLTLCHSVSIIILLLEFWLINAVPILMRHFSVIFGIIVLYMIENMTVTLCSGKAVYPGITWDSTSGILIPIGVFIICFIFYAVLTCCSKCKMKRIDKDPIIAQMEKDKAINEVIKNKM